MRFLTKRWRAGRDLAVGSIAGRCALVAVVALAGLLTIRAFADDAPESTPAAAETAQGEAASSGYCRIRSAGRDGHRDR
jgi:hypothetical protein